MKVTVDDVKKMAVEGAREEEMYKIANGYISDIAFHNYKNSKDEFDKLINELHFKLKDYSINNVNDIKTLLKDESIKNLFR